MKNVHMRSIDEVKQFLQANKNTHFTLSSKKEKYDFIRDTCAVLRYATASKKDRGIVKNYLIKVTGYSNRQMKRLVSSNKKKGLCYSPKPRGVAGGRKYGPEDIALIIKTDELHKTPNGRAVQEILQREFLVFGNKQYETVAGISVSHIYNVRNTSQQYLSSNAIRYSKTNPVSIPIGERKKPQPNGKPGFLRVDSVHQGDLGKVKGVYHINIVDEVTQYEIVGCTEKISEYYLTPLLQEMLDQFPFVIHNFHSDNGSEYINQQVADILNRLMVKQTKSRSRRTNDNALVEGKNGSVIRKHMGRCHIPQKNATLINGWYVSHFNTYINFHRICGFSTDRIDKRGKVKKKYDVYMTPYEKFKLLPNAKKYLKPGTTFEFLDKIAYAKSDNEFAEEMRKAKKVMVGKLTK